MWGDQRSGRAAAASGREMGCCTDGDLGQVRKQVPFEDDKQEKERRKQVPFGEGKQKSNGEVGSRALVAEACGDSDFVTAFGATAIEDGLAGFGFHAGEEAVHFGAVAAVGLKGALGHRKSPARAGKFRTSEWGEECGVSPEG